MLKFKFLAQAHLRTAVPFRYNHRTDTSSLTKPEAGGREHGATVNILCTTLGALSLSLPVVCFTLFGGVTACVGLHPGVYIRHIHYVSCLLLLLVLRAQLLPSAGEADQEGVVFVQNSK